MKKLLIIGVILVFVLGFTAHAVDPVITVMYEDLAQVELIGPSGERVMIDVVSPDLLSSPATKDDIALTTHGHGDHMSGEFLNSFPGKKLTAKAGTLIAGNVKVTGIPSSHSSIGEFLQDGSSNYIFLVEMNGFRIAHFGGIGQDQFTPEQLKTLGDIDIAITQIENSYSGMSLENRKGFKLMDQLKPKLIIPTHLSDDTVKYAFDKWDSFYLEGPLKITKNDLDGKTKFIVMGTWGSYYGKTLKLAKAWK